MSNTHSGKQLNLRTIPDIDNGKVELAVNHAIQQVVRDVTDRPGDKGKRTVTIKIHAVPVLSSDTAVLDTVGLQFEISQHVPKRRNSEPYLMLPMADGTLSFQPDFPTDPRQRSLFAGRPEPELRDGESMTDDGEVTESTADDDGFSEI